MTDLTDVANQLAEIARVAGAEIQAMGGLDLDARLKGPAEVVTLADQRSHEIMTAELTRRFPGVAQVLEEQDNPPVLPDTYLVADELDGTAIYAAGHIDWGVTLALVEGGRPVAGALYQPVHGRMITAWRGGGAWSGGRRLAFAPGVTIGASVALAEVNRFLTPDHLAWVGRVSQTAWTVRALGSAVGAAIELLSGRACLYLNCRGAKVWDFAAAVIAVEEAGGIALGLDGGPLDWSRAPMGALLAASREVAAATLALRDENRGLGP